MLRPDTSRLAGDQHWFYRWLHTIAKVGLAVLCPITNQIKGYPFEVPIPHGLKVTGAILSDQIKNLDWKARDTKLICKLPSSVTDDALRKLNTLLRVA